MNDWGGVDKGWIVVDCLKAVGLKGGGVGGGKVERGWMCERRMSEGHHQLV